MQTSPIKVEEQISLTSLGIPSDVYKQSNLSLESDRFVTIKEAPQGDKIFFNIVDMTKGYKLQRKELKADSILMHPSRPIISMRTGGDQPSNGIQIVDLNKREVSISEQIQFWTWVNETTLGLVCTRGIYHIDIAAKSYDAGVTALFRKSEDIERVSAQILKYAVDSSGKWCVLFGIYSDSQTKTLHGMVQLYSIEQKASQNLEGFVPHFADVALVDANYKNTVLPFVGKKPSETFWNFLILEVGKPIDASRKVKKKQKFQMAPDVSATDIPILSYISEKYALTFIIAHSGYLYVHQMFTGFMIYRGRISTDMIIACCKHTASDGMLCVNKKGVVLLSKIDEGTIVNYIQTRCSHIPDAGGIAFKIAQAGSLPGAEQLLISLFNKYFSEQDYTNAAKTAAQAPNGILRTAEIINKFKNAPKVPGSRTQPLLQYFSYFLESNVKLNATETMELVRPILAQGKKRLGGNLGEGK